MTGEVYIIPKGVLFSGEADFPFALNYRSLGVLVRLHVRLSQLRHSMQTPDLCF